jgi:hypothetical protein
MPYGTGYQQRRVLRCDRPLFYLSYSFVVSKPSLLFTSRGSRAHEIKHADTYKIMGRLRMLSFQVSGILCDVTKWSVFW